MDADELIYNPFYLLLRNEFKKKHELALSKCWTICVPSGDSLREVSITKEFIDDHVLRPLGCCSSSSSAGNTNSRLRFVSTDEAESHVYEVERNTIRLVNDDDAAGNNSDYNVYILSTEKGYNKEFQPYNIIIVDRPIHRKYRIAQITKSDRLKLNRNVTSYREALEFLKELPEDKSCSLDDLVTEVEKIEINKNSNAEKLRQRLHQLFRDYWASTMRKQSLDVQRDARFQKLLSVSIEIFVMHLLHESLYLLLSFIFEDEDAALKEKIDELLEIGITPDQLGVKESLAISLPSAMVELATLDSYKGPLEKLMCLRGTIDLIVAEIKGAIADVESKTDCSNDNEEDALNHTHRSIGTDDLIPLLLFVIIKCRCQRLYTDLFYLENFIWSGSPHDELSYTLVTFKAALALLDSIDPRELPKRSERVKSELKTSEFLGIAKIKDVKTPLDKQMHDLAKMLEECTQR